MEWGESMIEFEIAGLFYAIKKALSKDKDNVYETYFDEIPKDIFLPCVYFPAPEITESGWSSSAYKATFTLYVTVMAPTTSQAARMATDIVLDISSRRKKIPIVKEDGTISSHSFRVKDIKADKADEGVYEIKVTWDRYSEYVKEEYQLVKDIYINKI